MDYHAGGDLAQLLFVYDKPFSEELAQFFIAETATAVDALHRLGAIHGDLTPSNLLLDDRGHIVLTDFGLSLKMDKNTGTALAKSIGSLGYCPPEMFDQDEYHSFPKNQAFVGRER